MKGCQKNLKINEGTGNVGIGIIVALMLILLLLLDNYIALLLGQYVRIFAEFSVIKDFVSVLFVVYICSLSILRGTIRYHDVVLLGGVLYLIILLLGFGKWDVSSLRYARALFTPFVTGALVARLLSGPGPNINIKKIVLSLIFVTILIDAYGFFQYFSITKPAQFWFYKPLTSIGFQQYEFDLFRYGRPRIASVFTSSLEFAFYNVIIFVLAFQVLVNQSGWRRTRNLKFFIYFSIGLFSVAIILSSVRSAQITYLISILYMGLLSKLQRNRRFVILATGLSIAFGLPVVIFLYLHFGFTTEPSALGRLVQWQKVIHLLKADVLGVGINELGPGQKYWFDSLWLNIIAGYGLFSIPIIFAFLYFYKIILDLEESLGCKVHGIIGRALLVIYPLIFANAFFQAFFNDIALYLLSAFVWVIVLSSRGMRAIAN